MSRISVPLNEKEKAALWRLAERERRDPRDQAAIMICQELKRQGELSCEAPKQSLLLSEASNDSV
jgi:hypothetical protein